MVVAAAVMDPSSGSTKQRGASSELQAPVAVLSSSGREVFVGLQQANRGFLLVYDLKRKKLLDIYKVKGVCVWGGGHRQPHM